jgi:preprotein translocase subunit SecE
VGRGAKVTEGTAETVMLDNLKDSPEQVAGWFGRGRRFFGEVRSELGRVTWPTRREVWATTVVVILTASLFGVYLYIVDVSLSAFMAWALGAFRG